MSYFKNQLFQLAKGDTANTSEPQGDFVLPKDATIPLVFVALGLGITPFLAMAEWLAEKGEQRDVVLIRQAKIREELLGGDVFAAAGIHVIGHIGRLTVDTIQRASDITNHTLIYIAGPEGGVRTIEAALKEHGVRPYQIVTDAFIGYSE